MAREIVFAIEATVVGGDARLPVIIDTMAAHGIQIRDIVDPPYKLGDKRMWLVDLELVHRADPYAPL